MSKKYGVMIEGIVDEVGTYEYCAKIVEQMMARGFTDCSVCPIYQMGFGPGLGFAPGPRPGRIPEDPRGDQSCLTIMNINSRVDKTKYKCYNKL